MTRKTFWLTFLGSCLGLMLLAGLICGSALYWAVAVEPGEEIEIENIRRILGKESPVFYSDGQTRLGVFFDQAHRQYVSYNEIPANFVKALVASEDNLFFSHFGFDPISIFRAAVKNLQAGRVVQGGSTLTQQTAKNLFKRSERSLQAKLKELLFALRLEYRYSKEQIFEFYANQFYVAGNSHGLGVAARYYFDKLPSELTLLECAFIAGSVKRPNYYNPFTKKSDRTAERARKRAKTRVNYVLNKMFELEMIDAVTYKQARDSDIAFKKGKVGYALDYVMEMVREAVSSTEVLEALKAHGISNVATSGIRVITSVDQLIQEKTLYALRRQLSRLDVRLRGYERQQVQGELAGSDYKGDRVLKERAFLFGTVQSVSHGGSSPRIEIDLGRKLGVGTVDQEGLGRLVAAWVKWRKNPWAEAKDKDYHTFLEQLQPGDRVWVSVRTLQEGGPVLLDLERFPLVQGGALVMRDGMIKAMAGGVENRFYNRAVAARRTMGSSFKPFLYTAALQLGWSATDLLKNKRDLFVFQDQAYFPRPDHKSPHAQVSMSWAGVHSENVASVWLLYHLCDQLGLEQLRRVAAHIDMAPRMVDDEEEPYRNFKARMRDKYGIVVNRKVLRKAAYDRAVANLETDFIFEDRAAEYERIAELHYGLGHDGFIEEIEKKLEEDALREEGKLTKTEKKELLWRKELLARNYLALERLVQEMRQFLQQLHEPREELYYPIDSLEVDEAGLYYDQTTQLYTFSRSSRVSTDMVPVTREQLIGFLQGQTEEEQREFWGEVYLDNTISLTGFRMLHEQVKREEKGLKKKLPYSLEVLSMVRDYRVMVGLHYLTELGKQAGIRSKLEPVLSFPLGSNVTTLLETVRMYEGLVTGEVVLSGQRNRGNQDLLAILDHIESADGEVLYTPVKEKHNVVAPEVRVAIGHVLENIVKFGTGRYADKHVRFSDNGTAASKSLAELDLHVPLLGKTGTANRYTNASFLGYLPGVAPGKDGMVMQDGYAVGVYVGFDDNKVMRKGATKVTGALGALPAWTEIVNGLLAEKGYCETLDATDLAFTGLMLKRDRLGQLNLAVQAKEGGRLGHPVMEVAESYRYRPSVMAFGKVDGEGRFIASRRVRLFQKKSE